MKKDDFLATETTFAARLYGPTDLRLFTAAYQQELLRDLPFDDVLPDYNTFAAALKLYVELYALFLPAASRKAFVQGAREFRRFLAEWKEKAPWDCVMDYFLTRGESFLSLSCPFAVD